MAEPEQKLVELKVVWNEAKDMPVSFSNVFLIQHSHAEFYLTFGSVDPPFYGPPTPAELADVQKNGVSAKSIIKLAIPPQKIGRAVSAYSRATDAIPTRPETVTGHVDGSGAVQYCTGFGQEP